MSAAPKAGGRARAKAPPLVHDVFTAHTVVRSFAQRLAVVDAWGEGVVGVTERGALVAFAPVPKNDFDAAEGEERRYELVQTVDDFAPRGCQQLSVLEDEALLLSLSDSVLTLHSLPQLLVSGSPGAQAVSRARAVQCVPPLPPLQSHARPACSTGTAAAASCR